MFGKISLYFCIKGVLFIYDTVKFGNINTIRFAVMGAESNAAFFFVWGKIGIAAFVEFFKACLVEIVVSYGIEKIYEVAVRLPVDMFKFNREQLSFVETDTGEEVDGIIILF